MPPFLLQWRKPVNLHQTMTHHLHRKMFHQNSCKYLVIEEWSSAVMGQSRMQLSASIGSNFAANQQIRHPLVTNTNSLRKRLPYQ
jgi:hypothetical protein